MARGGSVIVGDVLTSTRQLTRRNSLLNYFSLFGSFSTLLCCAIPSVLVLLGLGTTVASLLSAMPWLVRLSHHKAWTFSISGSLIALSFLVTYAIAPRLRDQQACAADDPNACGEASKLSKGLLWFSAAIWAAGFFVAYLLGPILNRMDAS